MKESVTYQAILNEGRAEEARRMLLLACEGRLGKPTFKAREALEPIESLERGEATAASTETLAAISSPEKLESLTKRVFRVETWYDLLAAG